MNPSDIQILFADLQPEIVARSKTTPPKTIAAAAGVLAEVAGSWGCRSCLASCRRAAKSRPFFRSWPNTRRRQIPSRVCRPARGSNREMLLRWNPPAGRHWWWPASQPGSSRFTRSRAPLRRGIVSSCRSMPMAACRQRPRPPRSGRSNAPADRQHRFPCDDAGAGLLGIAGCRNLRHPAEAQARLSRQLNQQALEPRMSNLFSLATLAIDGTAQAAIKMDDGDQLTTRQL